MITQQQKDLCQDALNYALLKGCQQVRIVLSTGIESSIEIRNNQIDKLMQSKGNGMAIYFYINQRFGSASTNHFDIQEIKRSIDRGVESTLLLTKDVFRQLPDPELYYQNDGEDLEICDVNYAKVTTQSKIDLAQKIYHELDNKDERILSSSVSLEDYASSSYMLSSNGFEGQRNATQYNLSASLSLLDGDSRPSAYDYDAVINWDELKQEGIALKAYENVLGKLNQDKIPQGCYTLITDYKIASHLLRPLIKAIQGSAIQQEQSFLLHKIGEQITAPLLKLTDTPRLKHHFGASLFDNNGCKTRDLPIIENGILQNYYISPYYSRKMDREFTASSPSIISCNLGALSQEKIIEKTTKGVFITAFNGGNCNPTTGDFSYGIEGFLIENGQKTQAMSGMVMTGNMLQLWTQLVELGNTPNKNSSWLIPTLVFKDIDLA